MDKVHFKARNTFNNTILEWEQYINKDSTTDVFTEGYLWLRDAYSIHDYVIIDVDIEEGPREQKFVNCYGCKHELGNQSAHMDCPNGCLHIHENCDICRD